VVDALSAGGDAVCRVFGKATSTLIQTQAVALIDLHQCDLRTDGLL
jgi:hypothetical protein